ncbi:aromatic ring-hydroxylating dioxygenase subunit alpha [Emcibacter sp. SYSU 3D8]|uniref:aromatic ring-hydroxylating oxygenase subunit alpha n=1 Tax=Emcibacter sp. SYSU 3D8 TaxID=3133969 RepID=UPI0031FEA8BB
MNRMTDMKPGEGRCPGISVQDLLQQDSRPAPDYLTTESYAFMGDDPIPFERYTSPDYFQQELKLLWPKIWQWACREEHIPEAGDYIVYDFGPYSVIVQRTETGAIKAFRNACTHRGTKLKPSFSEGSGSRIRCPYHGWTWDLEGTLTSFPCEWDFPHVDPADYALDAVRVDTWGGFVFINLDPDAVPLHEYMHPLPEHIDSAVFEARYVAMHVQKELHCNWKVASEAFLEAYHVMETHSQLMRASGDANTQYDYYGEHVNRLIAVGGSPSVFLEEPITEQEILDTFLIGDRSDVGDRLLVPEGGTARKVMAQYYRDMVAGQGGADLSAVCDSEIVDSIAYFVFPNQQFFSGVSFPIVYRFRPLGMQHDKALFDLVILKPKPLDGEAYETAVPVRLKAEESYTIVPGMDPYVGHVFDQDTGNMEAAQEGAMTTGRRGATLGNYQEIRIRHMHRTLEKYLGR